MRATITTAALAAMVLSGGSARAGSVCGDVNKSNTVTAADALAVLKAAVGQAVTLLCAPSGELPKTGQTQDYGVGSDGTVQAGASRAFTDNGDGTITDDVTGLVWEKKDDSGGIHDKDNTYTWSTGTDKMNGTIATVFLASLNGGGGFAGHSDWRVPNRFEMESLLNLGAVSPSAYATFHTNCTAGCTGSTCSCTRSDGYWTSSTSLYGPSDAWFVYFSEGSTYAYFKTNKYSVRAVRGGSS